MFSIVKIQSCANPDLQINYVKKAGRYNFWRDKKILKYEFMKLDCILEIHCLAPLQLKKNYNIKFKASNLNTIKNGKKEQNLCDYWSCTVFLLWWAASVTIERDLDKTIIYRITTKLNILQWNVTKDPLSD